MLRDSFGSKVQAASTRWIEPPWKVVLSNKGILPLLWEMFPNHPNLLPSYFEEDPTASSLGSSYVRKPIYSREGANIELVSDGTALDEQPGPYGSEGFVRQAFAPLPSFRGPVSGGRELDRRRPCLRAVDPRGHRVRSRATPRDFCRTRSFKTRRHSGRRTTCYARAAALADGMPGTRDGAQALFGR